MNYWLELSARYDYDLNQERKRTPYSVEGVAVTWDMAAYPSLHRISCVALWVKNNQILDPVKIYLNYDLLTKMNSIVLMLLWCQINNLSSRLTSHWCYCSSKPANHFIAMNQIDVVLFEFVYFSQITVLKPSDVSVTGTPSILFISNLRYHIIDLPGVLGNNVLGSYNCSYDLIRCIKKCAL